MQAFDALLTSLDTRGLRESHLHIMMKKIETPFRERVRRNTLQNGSVVQCRNATGNEVAEASSGGDSPSSMVCSTSSDRWEPSFKIELGKNEEEKRNVLRRYQDFQVWMWKEHFGSSVLSALAHGQKRCLPLLGVCDRCLDTFLFEEDFCSSCHRTFDNVDFVAKLLELEISYGDIIKFDSENVVISSTSCPLRIILIKALLSMLEVRFPCYRFNKYFGEDC